MVVLRVGFGGGAEVERHASPGQLLLQLLGGGRVESGQDLVHQLEDHDLRADIDQQAGEFAPDDAAPDDAHALRPLRPIEGMVGADDPLAVEGEAGDLGGHRPGGEDDRPALELGGSFRPLDRDLAGSGETAVSVDHLDLAALEEPAQPSDQTVDDLVLAFEGHRPFEARLGRDHAELSGRFHRRIDLGGLKPALGRDAAPQQTGATDRVGLLDESHGQPEVVGVERSGVAARTAADDHDVVHVRISRSGCRRSSLVARRTCRAEPVGSPARRRYAPLMQTRYLIIAALVTALVILGATGVWFIVGLLES